MWERELCFFLSCKLVDTYTKQTKKCELWLTKKCWRWSWQRLWSAMLSTRWRPIMSVGGRDWRHQASMQEMHQSSAQQWQVRSLSVRWPDGLPAGWSLSEVSNYTVTLNMRKISEVQLGLSLVTWKKTCEWWRRTEVCSEFWRCSLWAKSRLANIPHLAR